MMDEMAQQPSARECFVCGVENIAGLHVRFFETPPTDGARAATKVTAQVTIPDQYQSYNGLVHGGIVATLLDETATRVYFRGDPPRFVVTAKLTVRYRKPTPVGQPLRLVAHPTSDKGKICHAEAALYDADGILLAEADVMCVEVDEAYMATFAPIDRDGWKVYKDAA